MNRYFYIPLLVVLASCSIFGNSPASRQGGGTTISENTSPIEQNPIQTIITPNTISKYGMFAVHTTPERDTVYFEIEDSLLGRHILVINRIAKVAARAGNHSGEELGNYTIMFEKGPHGTIQLKQYKLVAEADPSNPLMNAISAANAHPVIEEYPILTQGKNGTSSVIDVTSLLKSPSSFVNFGKAENLSGTFKDHEIKSIRVFPENIEINISKNGTAFELDYVEYSIPTTFESHTSFLLLPKVPMQKRIFDQRVGFFEERYMEFGDSSNVKPASLGLIKRWRLEPKPEDWEKYIRGELVEPVKPIVFYIDPAVPKKWVKYMIEGINAWQVAFEKAGFKNAIWGREWTESDSLPIEDMRYSFIRYFASDVMNAFGPHVSDPRSGEIITTNVCFYNNIMTILHDWYQVQVGPLDPRAQADIYDDDLMGRMIGYVVSHEVGHSIGLRHNFGASSKVPVDSLRSVSYLRKHGQSPSIMDYARHNYVAQPEDSIPTDLFITTIGEYDKWAIEWGYRLNNLSLYEDWKFLSKLTTERLVKNPSLEWGNGEERGNDPRNQTEDMGDDGVKASTLGLKNLKRVMENLVKWNAKETDFNNYSRIYQSVRLQYRNYMNHVGTIVGGCYQTLQTDDSSEPLVKPVPREKQIEAFEFIISELINTPKWLLQPEFLNKFHLPRTMDEIEDSQIMALEYLINGEKLRSILNMEVRFGKDKTLRLDEVLDRIRNALFGGLSEKSVKSDVYLRGMQRRYVNNLFVILFEGNNPKYMESDIIPIVTTELKRIRKMLSDAQSKAADPETESHNVSLVLRIDRLNSTLAKAKKEI